MLSERGVLRAKQWSGTTALTAAFDGISSFSTSIALPFSPLSKGVTSSVVGVKVGDVATMRAAGMRNALRGAAAENDSNTAGNTANIYPCRARRPTIASNGMCISLSENA